MALDLFKNFAKVTVSTGYDAAATSVVLASGHGMRLPAVPFNVTWWNSTDYPDPTDDPNVEIVRVTAMSVDTLTVTRGQESITATTKNTASKTYKMIAGLSAKTVNTDIPALIGGMDHPVLASAEIGLLSSTIVVATFDEVVKAPDYKLGVTIKVDAVAATISTAARNEGNKTQVRFTLSAPVGAGDVVTISYVAVDGFIENQYGIGLEDLTDAAVTNNTSSILLVDNFTDADGTALPSHTMDTGAGWTRVEGTATNQATIQGNKLANFVDAASAYCYLAESGQANVEASMTGVFLTTSDFVELIVRATDASNYIKLSLSASGSPVPLRIVKREAGTDTVLHGVAFTVTAGVPHNFTLTANGSTLDIDINGTPLSISSTFNQTATKCGFRIYTGTGSPSTVDNFSVIPA